MYNCSSKIMRLTFLSVEMYLKFGFPWWPKGVLPEVITWDFTMTNFCSLHFLCQYCILFVVSNAVIKGPSRVRCQTPHPPKCAETHRAWEGHPDPSMLSFQVPTNSDIKCIRWRHKSLVHKLKCVCDGLNNLERWKVELCTRDACFARV